MKKVNELSNAKKLAVINWAVGVTDLMELIGEDDLISIYNEYHSDEEREMGYVSDLWDGAQGSENALIDFVGRAQRSDSMDFDLSRTFYKIGVYLYDSKTFDDLADALTGVEWFELLTEATEDGNAEVIDAINSAVKSGVIGAEDVNYYDDENRSMYEL